jgi:predicted MFS family arabinose efflux permease
MTTQIETARGTVARVHSPGAHGRGFWFVTIAFFILMAFGTAPTALWPLFEAHDGFGTTVVTIAFAAMVVGAAASFLVFGHLSDRHGRRRLIIPALLVGIAGVIIITVWQALPGLLVGRFVNGIGVGLMASTATAYLSDLYYAAHPERRGSARPALIATAANLGGLAMGPVVAGLLAQFAPAPLVMPFALLGAGMLVFAILTGISPETVDREQSSTERTARIAFQPRQGRIFLIGAASGLIAFAVFGLFSAVGAIITGQVLGLHAPLMAAASPFAVFAASAISQLALGSRPLRFVIALGAILLAVGLALTSVTLFMPTLWMFLVAAVLAGAGGGLLFKAGLTISVTSAVQRSRAGVLALFFATVYLGMGIPAVLFSFLIAAIGLPVATIGFSVIFGVGAFVVLGVQRRRMAVA